MEDDHEINTEIVSDHFCVKDMSDPLLKLYKDWKEKNIISIVLFCCFQP